MKTKINNLRILALFLFVLGLMSSFTTAQTVNIKMRFNSSTCLDTLRSYHVVQIRGESAKGTTPPLTWDQNTGVTMTNQGGDYWEATFQALPNDTIKYKFWTGFTTTQGTFHWNGWEGPLNPGLGFDAGGNRAIIVGNTDMDLDLQYFNGWESTLDQYWRPYEVKDDSIAVYFRVNMGGVVQTGRFDPATMGPVGVRGGAPLSWDESLVTLTRETNSVNSGSFWSGVGYLPKNGVTIGANQEFKFYIENSSDGWENGIPNRTFLLSVNLLNIGDTTLSWYYFENKAPRSGNQVTGNVNFRLRLDALEKANLFNRGLGDEVIVIGAKGWDLLANAIPMTFVPAIQEWIAQEPFTLFPETPIIYKYYIRWDTTRVDPAHANYIPGLTLDNGWEEPGVTGGSDRNYLFQNAAEQTVPGDFGADQQFFNSLHPNGVLTTPITLSFAINMAPAADAGTNPTNTLFRPGIDTAYVQFDGCMIPITQGLSMYGTDNRLMLEDDNGDGIYTGSVDLTAPTFYQVCYRIVYTSSTGEVWNGGGVQLGRRYYQYIVPTAITPAVTWPATFQLAQLDWAPGDLPIETPPDLGPVSDVDEETFATVNSYELSQNYPNPFNPSTVITFSLPEKSIVRLEVYNILGEKVITLFDGEQTTGKHSIAWNAKNQYGIDVASGVYLVKMNAGSFSQTKKMMLIR
ncbi:MAG: T9SS type A sorting domain-containing protein [bacterium]